MANSLGAVRTIEATSVPDRVMTGLRRWSTAIMEIWRMRDGPALDKLGARLAAVPR